MFLNFRSHKAGKRVHVQAAAIVEPVERGLSESFFRDRNSK